tara:strand:+ start:469 stop:591 length:123 start_codon:yes stop_codon:yes gene_type:complete
MTRRKGKKEDRREGKYEPSELPSMFQTASKQLSPFDDNTT